MLAKLAYLDISYQLHRSQKLVCRFSSTNVDYTVAIHDGSCSKPINALIRLGSTGECRVLFFSWINTVNLEPSKYSARKVQHQGWWYFLLNTCGHTAQGSHSLLSTLWVTEWLEQCIANFYAIGINACCNINQLYTPACGRLWHSYYTI